MSYFEIIPERDYRKNLAIAKSDIDLIAKSPLHYENRKLFRQKTEAMSFGSALHLFVLEPEKFELEVAVSPDFNLRTKQGKTDYEAFKMTNNDKIVISEEQFNSIKKMKNRICKIYGSLLENTIKEASFFAEDKEFGIVRKCRVDAYNEKTGLLIDLKTTSDISDYGIRKSILSYGYDIQADYYLDTVSMTGAKAKKFIFIFVEKKAPFMVRAVEIDYSADMSNMFKNGREKYRKVLKEYKDYRENNTLSLVKKFYI